MGTVDTKVWREGMSGKGNEIGHLLEHMADFKKVFDLKVTGGWGPA
jgi:hypothetical protein